MKNLKLLGAGFRNIQSLVNAYYKFSEGLNVIKTKEFQNNVGKSILFKCIHILTGNPKYTEKKLYHVLKYGESEGTFWIDVTDGSAVGFRLVKQEAKHLVNAYFFIKKANQKEAEWCDGIPYEFLNSIGFLVDEKSKFCVNIADSVTGRILDSIDRTTLYGAIELITNSQELNDLADKTETEILTYNSYLKDLKLYKKRFDKLLEINKYESTKSIEHKKNKIEQLLQLLEPLETILDNLDNVRLLKNIDKINELMYYEQYLTTIVKLLKALTNIRYIKQINVEKTTIYSDYLVLITKLIKSITEFEEVNKKYKESLINYNRFLEQEKEQLKQISCPVRGEVIFFHDGCIDK